jgi:hypothetical protein
VHWSGLCGTAVAVELASVFFWFAVFWVLGFIGLLKLDCGGIGSYSDCQGVSIDRSN